MTNNAMADTSHFHLRLPRGPIPITSKVLHPEPALQWPDTQGSDPKCHSGSTFASPMVVLHSTA